MPEETSEYLAAIFTFYGVFTLQGQIVEANDALLAAACLAGPGAWIRDAGWWRDEAARRRLQQGLDQAARGSRLQYQEAVHLPDHGMRRLHIAIGPVRSLDGRVTRLAFGATELAPPSSAGRGATEAEPVGFAARQAAILDALPAHVALLDQSGTIIAVNEAWRRFAAGNGVRDPAAFLGCNYLAACMPSDGSPPSPGDEQAVAIAAALPRILTGELQHFTCDYPCPTAQGERWFRLMATPLPLGAGHGGAVVLHLDVTTNRRTEEALRQMQKMEAVGRLTSGLAHDFNNILVLIIGGLELLMPRLTDGRSRALAGKVLAAAERGSALAERLLRLSRREPTRLQLVDVNEAITIEQKLLQQAVGGTVSIACDLSPEAGSVLVDPNELATALLNLAVNARDAMPEGGQLRLCTCRERATAPQGAEQVVITVQDTGQGMPPEVMARVFEPFFTTKGPGRGTGLGLAQVHGFARQSGGSAHIASAPGQGTTVTIRLPHHDEEPAAPVRLQVL
ncbi:two-component system sensor histidine kinase NtrB [Rhodovastum atsumiense]|nr:PAS domain-containing sensor histidine kinase [Rhodovastum atsumiense]